MYRARTGGLEGIEQLVRQRGANPVALMESIGLSAAQFRDPNQYIAYTKLAELLHVCSTVCNEPQFGLLLAQRQTSAVLGALPLIASRVATVGEALEWADRYLYLHASGVRMIMQPQGDTVRLTMSIAIGHPAGMDQLMQLTVAHLALFLSSLLDCDPYALPLSLRQAEPVDPSLEGSIRFHKVQFAQTFDGIAVAARQLQRATHRDEVAINVLLEAYLGSLESRYPNQLEEQVADVIRRLLPTGDCSLEEVAATLNRSSRTLQAQLKARGTGYGEILRDTRYNLSVQWLSESNVSITDLALHLGYADVAVFSRHFKAWSGQSPRAWRKARSGG